MKATLGTQINYFNWRMALIERRAIPDVITNTCLKKKNAWNQNTFNVFKLVNNQDRSVSRKKAKNTNLVCLQLDFTHNDSTIWQFCLKKIFVALIEGFVFKGDQQSGHNWRMAISDGWP